jgi:hypothetical protein
MKHNTQILPKPDEGRVASVKVRCTNLSCRLGDEPIDLPEWLIDEAARAPFAGKEVAGCYISPCLQVFHALACYVEYCED